MSPSASSKSANAHLEGTGRLYTAALTAVLLVGIALRTIEYAAMGSLWLDELFVAINVTNRGWNELLSPLDWNQVVPIGFLVATKAATIMGVNEATLRLLPYLCSVGALLLFWRVSIRFLSPPTVMAGNAIFAFSPVLLWLARNLKQYSGDVAVVLLLVFLVLRFQEGRKDWKSAAVTAILGGTAMLFSQPSALVGGFLLVLLMIQGQRSGQPGAPIGLIALAWLLGQAIVVATSLALSPSETREFMRAGWSGRGFLPLGPEAIVWLPHRLVTLLGLFVGQFKADTWEELLIASIYGILAAIGLPYLVRRSPGKAAILCAPLIAGLFASAARILPLSGRVSIYLGPILLILAMAGLDQLSAWLPERSRKWTNYAAVGLAMVPFLIVSLVTQFPDRREEARPVLETVRSRWLQGDVLYVMPTARLATQFYGEPLGLVDWHEGEARDPGLRARLEEVDALRGQPRVWFFFTHAIPCEQRLVRAYLESIGEEIDRIEDPYGIRGKSEAAAYLYDLSDPDRLAASSASAYPIPDHIDENCGSPEDSPWSVAKNRLRRLNRAFD